jgi:hypothetical protein
MKIALMFHPGVWNDNGRLILDRNGFYLSITLGSVPISTLKTLGYQFKDILI